VPLITWYTWGDYHDPSGTNQEAHFGFFRDDGHPKPAYLALSGSELFARYLNEAFQVMQGDYDNLGLLMIVVALIGLTQLLGLPWLRWSEAAAN